MKKRLLLAGFCLLTGLFTSHAQNKTMGVGTATPNPNAVLHIESPTTNQGFIMPRLTTAQRLAMNALLTVSDNGLMLYDTDLGAVYIWDGAGWNEPGNDLKLPLTKTLTNADNLTAQEALNITYTGDSSATLLHLHYANALSTAVSNPFKITHAGQGAAFVLSQTGTLGTGAIFSLTNASNPQQAFRASTTGTGQAGNFRINNSLNNLAALYATTNGTGPGLFAENTGIGNGFSGSFQNTQTGNTYPAVQASTKGAGPGVRVIQSTGSVGGGMDVYIQEATNSSLGFAIDHQGTGSGLSVNLSNTTPFKRGIDVIHNGSQGETAKFENSNSSNANATIYTLNNGAGAQALSAITTGNALATILGQSNGPSGNAGKFLINNPANTAPALYASTNGTGAAISADNTSTGDAVYVLKSGTGGSAGNFQVSNSANPNSALFALTNAPTGTALGLINSAGGNALAIFQGGMRLSNATLAGDTTITTRAAAYLVTVPGNYTFSGTLTMNEGDIFYFFNSSGGIVTVASVAISAGAGRTYIYLGGILRGF